MLKDDKNTAIYVAYEDNQHRDPASPEKGLLVAILMSALSDLKKPGEAGRKATEYLLDPEDEYVFSFQAICDYLSIDPKRILRVTGLRNKPLQATNWVEEVPARAAVNQR